jgi:Zn ribbon nucleic-acid-binding protein
MNVAAVIAFVKNAVFGMTNIKAGSIVRRNNMDLFECQACGNKDAQSHEELVQHVVTTHPEYSQEEAIHYALLWEEGARERAEVEEIYEEDVDEDPL